MPLQMGDTLRIQDLEELDYAINNLDIIEIQKIWKQIYNNHSNNANIVDELVELETIYGTQANKNTSLEDRLLALGKWGSFK